ncbi:hypothetical protein D3880_02210 [Pseudomonas cavernae]|uniref:Uncharacterized protein n=1 Tax=Pseudomonas cavernae TaxID=2320867 RepID=A0A385YXI9_9PSED|nr:hypothetical protein D3880_02210 [Pseudomonas cavernae]
MQYRLIAQCALAFLWLATALVSVTQGRQIGYDILAGAGIAGFAAHLCVYGGAVLDLLLGLWLLAGVAPRVCLRVQAAVVVLYTLLLSIIDPGYRLQPFGPLTKNIPLLALIYLLQQTASRLQLVVPDHSCASFAASVGSSMKRLRLPCSISIWSLRVFSAASGGSSSLQRWYICNWPTMGRPYSECM